MVRHFAPYAPARRQFGLPGPRRLNGDSVTKCDRQVGSRADVQPSTGQRSLQLVRDPAHLPHGIADDAATRSRSTPAARADRNAQVEPTTVLDEFWITDGCGRGLCRFQTAGSARRPPFDRPDRLHPSFWSTALPRVPDAGRETVSRCCSHRGWLEVARAGSRSCCRSACCLSYE